jgi:hypothetical protein
MVLAQKMIARFYRPFLSGIFLENDLPSRRMFDFVMKMFSDGDVAVPALGMENSKTISRYSFRRYSMSYGDRY